MPSTQQNEYGLDRQSGIELWRQIADALRLQISTGEFDKVAKLPSEKALAERYRCNRHTVRAALSALAVEQVIQSRQGKGTFILDRKRITYPIGRRTRFSDGVANQAETKAGLLLSTHTEDASPSVATALDINVGQKVVRLETLSKADDVALSRATSWFSVLRFANIAALYVETGSITQALKSCGVADYLRRSTQIEARYATADDANDLALSAGAIVLTTEAINTDIDGKPIQYSLTRFAADRVRLSIENEA